MNAEKEPVGDKGLEEKNPAGKQELDAEKEPVGDKGLEEKNPAGKQELDAEKEPAGDKGLEEKESAGKQEFDREKKSVPNKKTNKKGKTLDIHETVSEEKQMEGKKDKAADTVKRTPVREEKNRSVLTNKNSVSLNQEKTIEKRFNKSQKVASAPSEKVAKMAKAMTTDPKYRGLISRAVLERKKAVETEEKTVLDSNDQKNKSVSNERNITKESAKKDEDIKVDADGNTYVQASMKFDENFEIMEF